MNNTCRIIVFLAFAWPLQAEEPGFRAVEPGVEYAKIVRKEGPHVIHVLRLEAIRPGWRWTTGLGDGRVYGLSGTPAIAKASATALGGRAVAAVNADFFVIARGNYQGDPLGLQIVEGELVSSSRNRTAVWFDAAGKPHMGKATTTLHAKWPDGKSELAIGLNERRADDAAVLYTPAMAHNPADKTANDLTTRTTDGREYLLDSADATPATPLRIGYSRKLKVVGVRDGGNSPIPKRGFVLSLGPKLQPSPTLLKAGDWLEIRPESTPDLASAANAVGGGERLLDAGRIATNGKAKERHPRTIIGWNDKNIFLVVVEGRARGVAIGMTYLELANLAKEFGCTDALNLDGGGSSTLWADGKVLNTPSDGVVRLVANALVLVETKANSAK